MGIPAEALLPFIFGNSGGGGGGGSAPTESAFIPTFGTLATVSTGTTWAGADPYTQTVTVTGYTVTANTIVNVLPGTAVIEQMIADGTSNIFISNDNGTLAATAIGAAPTAAMTLQVLCSESDTNAELGNLPAIVGDGVLETLQATDLTDAINQIGAKVEHIVGDVQISGTSIVDENGVANVPIAANGEPGIVKVHRYGYNGISVDSNGEIKTVLAADNSIKDATGSYGLIGPNKQYIAAFYGLAKAAGDSTQSASANAVGTYTEDAMSKIHDMLNSDVAVSGTDPVFTAKSGISYVCGQCATLTITPPSTGCFDVTFETGSVPTILTISGVTWMNGFDPDDLLPEKTYEINVRNLLGVAAWT